MKKVQGIYDDNDQLLLLATLTTHSPMMGMIFYLGVVSGLRISDLLALTVGDISKNPFTVRESKTKKLKHIKVPKEGWLLLQLYAEGVGLESHGKLFPTTRQTVHRYFKRAAADLGLTNIGTHTMRKTYAWNVFRVSQCLDTTRQALNHRYISTTVLYLVGGFIWAIHTAFNGKKINTEVLPHFNT